MKIKKLICLCLVFIICLCTPGLTKAAESEKISDIELLNMLGIFKGFEDGSLHPDWSITRMEFAAIIIRALGYDNGISQSKTEFSDVPEQLWGSGYIKMAYDLGIVHGYGDATFCPENKISEAESVKMIVAALGYGYHAEKNGGYPMGYINMAMKLNILNNVADSAREATRGYVASTIVNALETQIISPEDDRIQQVKDSILMRLDVTVLEGMLTAVYGSSLDAKEKLKKGNVKVSGEIYKTKLNISSDYLGTHVKIYIKNRGKSDELLVGIAGTNKSDVLTIDAKDIDEDTTLSALVYKTGGKKKTSVTLAPGLKIVYNGVVVNNTQDYTTARLIPATGSVKLIDSDYDGLYETAIVKDYKTLVVKGVSSSIISDIYGGKAELDEETILSVSMDNIPCELSDIRPNDVLSAAVSLDGKNVDIIICRATVETQVQSYEDAEERLYYTDDGKEYRLSDEYTNAIANGYSSAEKIEPGDYVKLYLNAFGEIAMAVSGEKTRKDEYYGFVVDMAKNNKFSKRNTVAFKILGESNNLIELDTVKGGKITFGRMDGHVYKKTKEDADFVYNAMLYNGKPDKQLVKYELKNGEIKAIYLRDNNAFSDNFSRDVPRQSLNVKYHTIDGKYYWDDETACFYIPQNGKNIAAISSGPCVDYFSGNDSLVMELWDIEDDGRINAIYCSDTSTGRVLASGSIYYLDYVNSPVMYVTKTYNITSENGTDYKVVEGWQDKKLVRTLLSDTLSQNSSDIRPGVVIQYTTNEQKKMFAETADDDVTMVLYTILFDMNNYSADEFMSYDYTGSRLDDARIQFGYSNISRIDYPIIRFEKDSCVFEAHTGTTVYTYSRGSREMKKVQAENLSEHTKVFMRARYGNLREVIIIED